MIHNFFTINNGNNWVKAENTMFNVMGFIASRQLFSRYIYLQGEGKRIILPAKTIYSNFDISKGKITITRTIEVDNVENGCSFSKAGFCTQDGSPCDEVSFPTIIKKNGAPIVVSGTLYLELNSKGSLISGDNLFCHVLLGDALLPYNIKLAIGNNFCKGNIYPQHSGFLDIKKAFFNAQNYVITTQFHDLEPYEVVLLFDDEPVWRICMGEDEPYVMPQSVRLDNYSMFTTSDDCIDVFDVVFNGNKIPFTISKRVNELSKTNFKINIGKSFIIGSGSFFAVIGNVIRVFSQQDGDITPLYSVPNNWKTVDICNNGSLICADDEKISLVLFDRERKIISTHSFSDITNIVKISAINISSGYYIMAKTKENLYRILIDVNFKLSIIEQKTGKFDFTKFKQSFIVVGDFVGAFAYNGIDHSLDAGMQFLQNKNIVQLNGNICIIQKDQAVVAINLVNLFEVTVDGQSKIFGNFVSTQNGIINLVGNSSSMISINIPDFSGAVECDDFVLFAVHDNLIAYSKSNQCLTVQALAPSNCDVVVYGVFKKKYLQNGKVNISIKFN